MQPPAYVITQTTHLANNAKSQANFAISRRRLARAAHSLDRWSWQWRSWSAVDGTAVTPAHWQSIGVEVLQDRGKLKDRPGAQGCWLSHWALWMHCVDTAQPLIVLEHDAIAMRPWQLDFSDRRGVVKLFTAPTKVNSITGQWSKGAWAYWIEPEAAAQLMAHAREHGAQALDKHLGDRVVSVDYLSPAVFKHDDQRDPSTTSWRQSL